MQLICTPARFPVGEPSFWRVVAARVADSMPDWLRLPVALDLAAGDPGARRAVRDAAELVIRAAVPGRMSFEQNQSVGMLCVMALDFGRLNGATAALHGRLLGELR